MTRTTRFACLMMLSCLWAPPAGGAPQAVLRLTGADGRTETVPIPAGYGVVQSTVGLGPPALRFAPLDGTMRVIVEFDAPPLADRRSRAAAAMPEERLARLRSDVARMQLSSRSGANAFAATITQGYSRVFSGAALTIAPDMLDRLRALPYVVRIVTDDSVHASLAQSVPLIRANVLRQATGASGAGVRVGIVDTGIDYRHVALGSGYGPGHRVAGGYDFANGDDDPLDDNGHGTHVAGIVAGNGGGLVGVAPGATLYAFKVLNASGSGLISWTLAGLERALDPDQNPATDDAMDVVNLSLGSSDGDPDDIMSLAIDRLTEAGIVCCVAAGNAGSYRSINSPGTSRLAITVGATDKSDHLAWFSSRGPVPGTSAMKPDLVAPGVDIVSCALGGGTVAMSGTSMATPHVAGCAALLLQRHSGWTPAQVKSALTTSVHSMQLTALDRGSGRVDAVDADAAELAFSPTQLAFGRVPTAGSLVARTDTLRLTNLSAEARTVTVLDSVQLAAGATVHLSPSSVTIPAGGEATVVATLAVRNAALVDPMEEPYGSSAVVRFTSAGRGYRIPATFHQHSLLSISSADGFLASLFIEDHTTRKLLRGGMTGAVTPLPAGTYDVTASFYPLFRIVTRTGVIVSDSTAIVLSPDEAVFEQSIDYTDDQGSTFAQNLSTLRVGRSGSKWQLVWLGFPVHRIHTSADMSDFRAEWSIVQTDLRSRWSAIFGSQDGLSESRAHANPPGSPRRFRMDVPQTAGGDSAAVLVLQYVKYPEGENGYFGVGSYSRNPALGPFSVDFEILPADLGGTPLLGNAIETYRLLPSRDIDWSVGPLLISPQLRTDLGWPLETYLGVFRDDPAAHFGGQQLKLCAGLPVWRGVVQWNGSSLWLHSGGPFYAPHLLADSYGSVRVDPDADYSLLQAGTVVGSGTLEGTGGFSARVPADVPVPSPGAYELRTHADYVRFGQPSRLEVSARGNTALPDPDPPSLRSFQVHASGQEADTIRFASDTQVGVSFRMSDAESLLCELSARASSTGIWRSLPLARIANDFTATIPPSLDGDVSLRLTSTDRSGNSLSLSWDHAFFAISGRPPGTSGALALTLVGAIPNPAPSDRLQLQFDLPAAGAAELDLLDVTGRRVAHEDLSSLTPGEHVIRVHPSAALRPGIYFARLTQGGRSVTRRVCVIE